MGSSTGTASSPAAIVFADLEGVLTTVNDAFLRLWGYAESSEVIGRPASELWADPVEAARQLAQVHASGRVQGEMVARRRDGGAFVARFTASVARDRRGVPLGVLGELGELGVLGDTIDRTATQTTAAQRRALQAIIDASPDWIFTKDLEHRLTLTNAAFASAMNLTPAEMENHLDSDFWPADECEKFHADDRRAFAGELVHNPNDLASCADGSLRVLDTVKGPLRDEQGLIAGVFSISRDMTERQRTAERLGQLTADLTAMLDAFPDLMLRIDADGRILDARAGRLDPSLEDPQLLIGWLIDEMFPPTLVALIRKGVQEALAMRQIVSAEYDTPDGLSSEGRFIAVGPAEVLVVIRNITERRRAERALLATEMRLREAQKLDAIGRLAGGVAHDFNNLLTVILSVGTVLREALSANAELAALSGDIIGAGERAAALTRQLLAVARAQHSPRRVVDLGDLIGDFRRVVTCAIGDNVTLAIAVPTQPHPIELDPTHVEQVLLNLAVNARDAMPDGGTVTIEVSNVVVNDPELQVTGPCVHLVVRDCGTGMTDEVRARVFEPFFTTKQPGKGTGLGLATVYGIVRGARGDITIETNPGAGTAFHIYLPRASTPISKPEPPIANPRGSETVLVVEDDPMVRSVTCRILKSAGYRVIEAPTGHDGLAIARSDQPFDAVISDVMMPGMTGPEMVRQLLALRVQPVLFITGHAGDEAVERLGRVLHKPFAPWELLRAVRSLLDNDRKRTATETTAAADAPIDD